MAIKINLLPREATAARGAVAIRASKLAFRGGLAVQLGTGLLVIVLLGLGVLGYMAWSAKTSYTKEVAELRARSEALKTQLTELRVAEQAKLDIQRRLDIIGRVAKSQGVPAEMMNAVLKAVPQGIWLTSFEVKSREAKVRVETGRPPSSDITRTLERLEQARERVEAPSTRPGEPAPKADTTKEVMQLQGFGLVLKGLAFNNFQLADFMDNLRKGGVFSDVDFVVTQAEEREQTPVMNFEVTAGVKL